MGKVKNSFNKLLKSNLVFWFVMFVSICQILIFLQDRSYNCLLVFIGSSFIIKKLSKNIVLSLFTAMLISNFIFGCKKVTEGLSNKTSTEDLKGMIDLVQSGKVNTDGIKNVANMANQLKSLQSSNGADMSLDMGSLNELLKFNSNISASKLTSKDEVKKAVNHLRANKELLKKMIDKF
jgi:hypothetical protein